MVGRYGSLLVLNPPDWDQFDGTAPPGELGKAFFLPVGFL